MKVMTKLRSQMPPATPATPAVRATGTTPANRATWVTRGGALLLVAGTRSLALRNGMEPAMAAEERARPSFSNPAEISHPFQPFAPGSMKIYSGTQDGAERVVVETHLEETRDFVWEGTVVRCRISETLEFLDGVPSGRERLFLAQANDGAVWTFGEVEDAQGNDPEDDADEPDGWIVGGRIASDPADTVTGAQPSMVFPADPKTGDRWVSEDAGGAFFSTCRVQSADETVRVRGARFRDCLRLVERDGPDASLSTRWMAPSVGLVRVREGRDTLQLMASTLGSRR